MHIIPYITYFSYSRYLEQCEIVFPYINGNGNPIMATGKNHSIRHTPGDVARYCDAINVSCDAPEETTKHGSKNRVSAPIKSLKCS